MNATSDRLGAYIAFFTTLAPDSLQHIDRVFTEGAQFRDPFNAVTGSAAIRRVFEHMFRVTEGPRFIVTEAMESGDAAFLRWVFSCRVRRRELEVEGVSYVRFAGDGRALAHLDYWDPTDGLYDRLPLFGAVLRGLRRRLSAA
ncbi:MAG: nuclear transport factor 2 family protein [Gammaproteobacteria bacterium]|jgi:ketosteroid isomerase-like protein